MSQNRIEITLGGQKFAFAIAPEHEASLRAAAAIVDEQLEAALSSGNRSIERAAIMTAIKLAGDLQAAKMNISHAENPGASRPCQAWKKYASPADLGSVPAWG